MTDPALMADYRLLRRLAVARRKQIAKLNTGRLGIVPDHVAEALVELMTRTRDRALAARRAAYR